MSGFMIPRRWRIFAITTSLFFLSQFYRASNAVIAPQLLNDLNLDTKGLGLLSASFFYAFALTQIPISVLIDRVGARRMMTGLSLVGVVGAFVFAFSDSLSQGIIGRVLLGIGMACNLMGTFKLLTLWFGPRIFATLTGLVFSIGTFGNMVATTPLVLLVQRVGWRYGFAVIGTINLIQAIMLYVIVRDKPEGSASIPLDLPETHSQNTGFQNILVLFRLKDYWIISTATFVRYGILAAIQGLWAGPYLIEVMRLSPLQAGNLILLLNLGMIIGGPGWGVVSDKIFNSSKWVVFQGLVVLFTIMLVMVYLPVTTPPLFLGGLLFCFGLFGASGGLMYAHIKGRLPLEMAGATMTALNFFTMIGPAVFLQGLGSLMQNLHPHASRGPEAFKSAFMLCTICLAVVSVLYLMTKEKEGAASRPQSFDARA